VVEQISASIQQAAGTTNEVAVQSAQAAAKANDGSKSVNKAISQMAQIEQTVNTSAKVVAELGERSKEIGQIVDAISGIAGQTNLLALNAAIEAARAGEQGRGFAVVADEVRKLAEQSQEAAKQIAELIGGIQGETDKAVLAMNDGTREVKLGAEVVNAAGQAFQEIVALVTQVSGQIKENSAAIEQMAIGSQQIVTSVNRIDGLSKKAAGEAETVSAATEEQSASMQEIASSSQSLANLAMELREAVSKFHV
jgi:methyl-accepting chemotaxis protein